MRSRYYVDGHRTFHYVDEIFFRWNGRYYKSVALDGVKADLYEYLKHAQQPTKKGSSLKPFHPNKAKVGNIIDALQAEAYLPSDRRPPAWLFEEHVPDLTHSPEEYLICLNGLLHLTTGELLSHTPQFFSTAAVDICSPSRTAM